MALVVRPSPIHSVGVYTNTPIRKGTRIVEYAGERITPEEADRRYDGVSRTYLYGLEDGKTVIDGEGLGAYLNHSCDPNGWLDDEVTLSARRDISAGEEITLDQGTWNFDEDEYVWDQDHCSCGASNCRRSLTPDDWLLPEVRARYRRHFHPHVQRMIDAESAPQDAIGRPAS